MLLQDLLQAETITTVQHLLGMLNINVKHWCRRCNNIPSTFFIIFGLLKNSMMTSPATRRGRLRVSSSDDERWSSDFFIRG